MHFCWWFWIHIFWFICRRINNQWQHLDAWYTRMSCPLHSEVNMHDSASQFSHHTSGMMSSKIKKKGTFISCLMHLSVTAWLPLQVCVTYRNCQNCQSRCTLSHMPQSVIDDSQLTGTLENATDVIIFPLEASVSARKVTASINTQISLAIPNDMLIQPL